VVSEKDRGCEDLEDDWYFTSLLGGFLSVHRGEIGFSRE